MAIEKLLFPYLTQQGLRCALSQDKRPRDCDYRQLEMTHGYALAKIFEASR